MYLCINMLILDPVPFWILSYGCAQRNLLEGCCVSVQHLKANLPSYAPGYYEQNVLAFLFYTKPQLLDVVFLDASAYGLNCW